MSYGATSRIWPTICLKAGETPTIAEIKAAIMGGHIHGAVEELAETLPLIEAGKLKSLCVIMETRHPALPNVPCSKELGIDYTHGLMRAWAIKKGPPPERQKFLIEVIKKSLDHPMYVKFIKDNHLDARPGYLGPEETRKYMEEQVEFFRKSLAGGGARHGAQGGARA